MAIHAQTISAGSQTLCAGKPGQDLELKPVRSRRNFAVRLFAILIAMGFLSAASCAAEIKLAPADSIILNPANDAGMFDLVLHTVGVAATAGETFEFERLRIEIMKEGAPVLTKYVMAARMVEETRALTSGPERIFLASQLLSPNDAGDFFGRKVEPATSPKLGPSQFLISTRHYFAVDFVPDEIRVTAEGSGGTVAATVPVHRYSSPITYKLPVDGVWALHSLPMLASHHRLNPPSEFAVDFFKTDGNGRNVVGNPLLASNALGYGAPIRAAAAGVAVFVIADDVQDRKAYLPRPGEDPHAADERISAFNMQRYAQDLRRSSAGNIVTLKHEANGVVEYTSYGHLKAGSVRVRVGDHVDQGQVIGAVGDTGDSPEVHLHFQVNSGPDAFTSKSLPAQFVDLKFLGSSNDPARFVTNRQ